MYNNKVENAGLNNRHIIMLIRHVKKDSDIIYLIIQFEIKIDLKKSDIMAETRSKLV